MNKHNQLIAAIFSRNPDLSDTPDDSPTEETIQKLYRMINRGNIVRADWDLIIAKLKTSIDKKFTHQAISKNAYLSHILAYMSGVGFDNFEQTAEKDIDKVLERFPTPFTFEPVEKEFLRSIKASFPPVELKNYQAAITTFKKLLYGEKQDYWDVVLEIETEALDFLASHLEKIYSDHAIISGDPWPQGEKEYTLTTDILKSVGLGPRHEIEVGGVEIALSNSFIAEGRDAVIGYVKLGDKVHVRSYYRSNSQGMWRYLPDYVSEEGKIVVFGRGYHQETLVLPSQLQKELSRINNAITIDDYPGTNMNFFLAGTAKRYETREEYEEKRKNHELSGDAYTEVSDEPMINFGEIGERKHPPESIDIDGAEGPNFRQELDSYEIDSNLYGKVLVRQFASYDSTLSYLLCEIGEGENTKAWIGNIEAKSPITSTGLKSEWISTGDIATPIYEHPRFESGFGDRTDRKGNYIGMWTRYVSRMPIIKRYFYSGREDQTATN